MARVDSNGDQPDVDQQQVPAYSGMQPRLNQAGERSKAYYQSTYPQPPSKSVINDIMVTIVEGMRQKNISFLFMVGDLPLYVYTAELKSENIVPVFLFCHQQLSFMYCIYKRFRVSGIADVFVSAGGIAEESVDQALCGKHYRRGVRCITLMREALIHSRVKGFLSTCIVTEKTEHFLQILRSALKESQDKLRSAHNCLEEDKGLNENVRLVYEPTGTDMGDYWISSFEMTNFFIQNIHACHVRNLSEYLS